MQHEFGILWSFDIGVELVWPDRVRLAHISNRTVFPLQMTVPPQKTKTTLYVHPKQLVAWWQIPERSCSQPLAKVAKDLNFREGRKLLPVSYRRQQTFINAQSTFLDNSMNYGFCIIFRQRNLEVGNECLSDGPEPVFLRVIPSVSGYGRLREFAPTFAVR